MGVVSLKQSRMEFKTTSEVKALLSKAATLSGVDLTAFVLESAAQRARKVLAEHATLTLSADQHAAFLEMLNAPPAPTEELVKLMSGPSLPTR